MSGAIEEVESEGFHRTEVPGVLAVDKSLHKRVDKEVHAYAQDGAVAIDPATNTRLRRMIDRRVLVVMVITYFVQTLDKGTVSSASIMGLNEDTKLVGQDFSWLSTCLYISIFVFEYPSNYIIQRVPIGKWLSLMIVCWAITLACHAACTNFTSLLLVRTLLGAFECVCQPAFVLLSAMWYKREEQCLIVACWYGMNGLQNVVGGLLSYSFSNIHSGPLKSWQALFLAYGLITIAWGLFVGWWLPDSPMKAKCFSEEDKMLMVERVRQNQTGLQNRKFRWTQVGASFKDPQVYAFLIIQICTTLSNGGFVPYANLIIKSFGFTTLQTQLLTMIIRGWLLLCIFGAAFLSRRFPNRHTIIMAAFSLPSIAGCVVLVSVENTSFSTKVGSLAAYYIIYSFWGTATLVYSLLTKNVAGATKKTTVVALSFCAFAIGNTIGPQTFQAKDAPRYIPALVTDLVLFCVLVVTVLLLGIYYQRENAKRDRAIAEGKVPENTEYSYAFDDLTDRENPYFRYVY